LLQGQEQQQEKENANKAKDDDDYAFATKDEIIARPYASGSWTQEPPSI
jgi:hypothetical protein